jgi:hypothetical protein
MLAKFCINQTTENKAIAKYCVHFPLHCPVYKFYKQSNTTPNYRMQQLANHNSAEALPPVRKNSKQKLPVK